MRSVPLCAGRWATLLASILVVGTAAAADVPLQDPAMMSPAVSPFLPRIAAPEPIVPIVIEEALPAPVVTGMGLALGADALDEFRGGDDVDNTVILDGSVTGNSADRIVSGSNLVQDGAFANASGINTVIQNSGSNVLIQNGMVVTVQFTAPGP